MNILVHVIMEQGFLFNKSQIQMLWIFCFKTLLYFCILGLDAFSTIIICTFNMPTIYIIMKSELKVKYWNEYILIFSIDKSNTICCYNDCKDGFLPVIFDCLKYFYHFSHSGKSITMFLHMQKQKFNVNNVTLFFILNF